MTTWVDLSLPLPDFLPPQDFRSSFYGLTPFDLERRLVKPDESGLSNLYFGVNPFFSPDARLLPVDKFGRRSIKFRDGTANESVAAVNCILAEIDVKDFDGNWQAVDAYIKSLPLKPSVIIKSGGGYHLYWLLRDTQLLYGEGFVRDLSRFEFIRGVQHAWVGSFPRLDQAAKGIPWLLRPAGSINVKEKYAPNYLSVDFIRHEMGLVYEVSHFQEVIKSLAKLTIVVPTIKTSQAKHKGNQQASKPATSKQQVSSQFSWQPPTFEYVPNSAFSSQQGKIEFHLQYFNHHDYDDWWYVGMVFLDEMGEIDGYEKWTEWSRKSHKFDSTRQKSEWEAIQERRKERIEADKTPPNLGSLIKKARRERGAPTTRDEGEYQPVPKPNNRVYLVELRCGVGEQLASLIKPHAWGLLNPEEADNVFWLPRRQSKGKQKPKPLESWVMDHIHGGTTRKIKIGDKRSKVKTCLVIAQTPMTRFWVLHAHDANQATSAQNALADIELISVSYPVNVQFEPTTKKGDVNGPIAIPYIYKADALSNNDDLEKMAISVSTSPFFDVDSVRREHCYVVLVLFSKDVPASLLNTHLTHTQLDPIALLALPSVSSPYFAEKTLKMSLCGPKGRREFILKSGNVGFRAWDDLLSADIFNDPTALTGFQVDNFEIQTVRAKNHEVGESIESVARWHNRRQMTLASQICTCGQALMTWDGCDGYEVGWCATCGGPPITSFVQEAHALNLTLEKLASQLTQEHQLGQAGSYVTLEQSQTAVDMDALKLSHKERVADTRAQIREDINRRVTEGTGKGRIAIIGATAGLGKSTITRELIPYWYRKLGLFTRVTTDTKNLSYEWHDGLKGGIVISSFVFESMLDCCSCYPYEVKQETLAAGYRLKHNKGCAFVKQIEEMLRGEDKKQKKVAILRHEHLRLVIDGKRLVAGADVYVSDEDLTKALIESDSVDLYTIVKATLTRMLDAGCNSAEVGIVAALFEVCRERRVGMYQHVDGSDIVKLMDEYLKEQGLTLAFCLEAIKKTPFAREPKLEPEDVENVKSKGLSLPKIWLPKFLAALEQTLKNPIHPSFFLVQMSKDKRVSRLEIESWIKHKYLPEYNRPLDDPQTVHIFLDATPNELIYKALLPEWEGKIDFLTYTCPPSPQHQIIQIDGLNLTRKYLKDKENLRVTVNKIATILNDFELVLEGIITRKDIKEPMARHFGLDIDMVLNFRNQRGSNKFSNAETVMVFADSTMPTNAALRFAHALWSHDSEPFEQFENGSYFAKSGAQWVALDSRLQAVLDRVKAEGNQGSQRIRLINVDGMKVLIIVSTYDAWELIDGLEPEQVTRIDARRLHGNNKEVRYASVTYHDRLIKLGRVADTGPPPPIETEIDDDFCLGA